MSGDPKFKLLFQFYYSINFNSSHTFLQFSHLQNQEGKRVVKNPPWNLWTWCFKLTICLIFGSEIEFGSSRWSEIWQPWCANFGNLAKITLVSHRRYLNIIFCLGVWIKWQFSWYSRIDLFNGRGGWKLQCLLQQWQRQWVVKDDKDDI